VVSLKKNLKTFAVVLLVALAIILVGCSNFLSPAKYFKANPEVKKFLDQYPDADFQLTHFSAEESTSEFANIKKICGKNLKAGKELYKAEINDKASGLSVVAYLDMETQLIECVRKFGTESNQDNKFNHDGKTNKDNDVSQDDKVSQNDLTFCKKLSACEQTSIEIKGKGSNNSSQDIYGFSVLGKDGNSCLVQLSAKNIESEDLKSFEKTSVTCKQEWSSKFEKIASFNENACKKYIDTLITSTLNHAADEKSTLCTGTLREKLLKR